jgi:aromatic-L-amino-acid decarboxylase
MDRLPSVLAEPPANGENIEDIADDFQNLIMPGVMHWQHPSFFAYFPAAGTLESIIGDLYAATAMNPGFNVRVPFIVDRSGG